MMLHKDQKLSLTIGKDIKLPAKLKNKTVMDFFAMSPLEAMAVAQMSYPQYQDMKRTISSSIAPGYQNALSLYLSIPAHLKTGIQNLDHHLSGGLQPGSITEICGPPGSGKTQFCLMMSVLCSLPKEYGGLGSKVIYIDTEGAFSAHRMVQMAKAHCSLASFEQEQLVKKLLEQVVVFTELTCDALNKRLNSLEDLLAYSGCGLICIDSMASLPRKEYDTRTLKGVSDRNNVLSSQAAKLKWLAEKFKLVVIVTNQIVVEIPRMQKSDWSFHEGSMIRPSLGNLWHHCINTRLMIDTSQSKTAGIIRTLNVTKSPVSANISVRVRIDSAGLVEESSTLDRSLLPGTSSSKC